MAPPTIDQVWDRWVAEWVSIDQWAARQRLLERQPLRIEPPVDSSVLKRAEEATGLRVPSDFAEVCIERSGRVVLGWYFGDTQVPFSHFPIVGGSVSNVNEDAGLWNAHELVDYRESALVWVLDVHEYPEDDNPWAEMLPIAAVGTGDYVALAPNGEVFVLEHETGEAEAIAASFVEFMTEWSILGCPIVYHLDQFRDPSTGRLSSSTERSREWLEWMNRDQGTR